MTPRARRRLADTAAALALLVAALLPVLLAAWLLAR